MLKTSLALRTGLMATVAMAAFSTAAASATTLVDRDRGLGVLFEHTASLRSGSFSHTLSFTLDNSAPLWKISGSASAPYVGLNFNGRLFGQGVTALSVNIFNQTHANTLSGFGFPTGSLDVSLPQRTVSPGSYTAVVSGVARDLRLIEGRPSYSFSLVASPVPEPGAYAMLLAGLGLMGFVARRRNGNI